MRCRVQLHNGFDGLPGYETFVFFTEALHGDACINTASSPSSSASNVVQGHSSCRRGFTLIELIVVISIITLLIALLLPALGKVKQLGRDTQCLVNLRQIGIGDYAYAMDSKNYAVPMRDSRYAKDAPSRLIQMQYLQGSTPREAIWAGGGASTLKKLIFCPDRLNTRIKNLPFQSNNNWSAYAGNTAIRGVWNGTEQWVTQSGRSKIFERYDNITQPSKMLLDADAGSTIYATNMSLPLEIGAMRAVLDAESGGSLILEQFS